MASDCITWGESYDISASLQDPDRNEVVIDGSWSAACRFCKQRIDGPVIFESSMAISENAASVAIDTGDPEWSPGVYFYDIRVTDADGNDYWSDPIQLTLSKRATPNT